MRLASGIAASANDSQAAIAVIGTRFIYNPPSVCLSVCSLITTMIPVKTADAIEITFQMLTRIDQRIHVLGADVYLRHLANTIKRSASSALPSDSVYRYNSVTGLYYKNATHQLTNVTKTHEKSLRKRIRIMYEIA